MLYVTEDIQDNILKLNDHNVKIHRQLIDFCNINEETLYIRSTKKSINERVKGIRDALDNLCSFDTEGENIEKPIKNCLNYIVLEFI